MTERVLRTLAIAISVSSFPLAVRRADRRRQHHRETGVRLVRRSVSGLMDSALPIEDQRTLQASLAQHAEAGVQFHALRTHQAGARRFVSFHVLVPGDWTVQRGHRLLERIEADIRNSLPRTTVLTHLESLDDPASWDDVELDRSKAASPGEEPQVG
jgi:divalent metal cation (Fe/Co/Zn/Cd) transporter